jgi:hypothetical protein
MCLQYEETDMSYKVLLILVLSSTIGLGKDNSLPKKHSLLETTKTFIHALNNHDYHKAKEYTLSYQESQKIVTGKHLEKMKIKIQEYNNLLENHLTSLNGGKNFIIHFQAIHDVYTIHPTTGAKGKKLLLAEIAITYIGLNEKQNEKHAYTLYFVKINDHWKFYPIRLTIPNEYKAK